MAVLFMDGFSHYAIADLPKKWTSVVTSNAVWTIESAGGRTAGALRKRNTSNFTGAYILKGPTVKQGAIWTPQQGGICGFAINVDDLNKIGTTAVNEGLFSIMHGETTQFTVTLNKDGTLSLWLPANYGPNVRIGVTSINAVTAGSWAYLEFKWIIHQTTGTFVIRVNGIEILNYTGQVGVSPYPFGPPPDLWTSIRFLEISSIPHAVYLSLKVCDFYLSDLSTPNGNFLGDISIAYIIPDGPGASTGWAATPAVPNWQNVKEVPPNADTDFNSALAVDTMDLYSFTPVTVNPVAMQHCMMGRRTAPGSALIESVVRHGGANLKQPAQAVQNETYAYNLFPYDTNPATGVKWVLADVNADEFGVNKAT